MYDKSPCKESVKIPFGLYLERKYGPNFLEKFESAQVVNPNEKVKQPISKREKDQFLDDFMEPLDF